MKSRFKFLFLSFFLLSFYNLSAQLDQNKGAKEKENINKIVLNNAKEVKKPKKLDLNSNNGFKGAYAKEKEKLKRQQAENTFNNKRTLTKAKINEEHLLKALKNANRQNIYPKTGQALVSFKTCCKNSNAISRGLKSQNRGKATMFVNNMPVVTNTALKENHQKFGTLLKAGVIKFIFNALSKDCYRPNRATLKPYNKK